MQKPIDFDARFQKYAETWVHNQLKAGKKAEELEEQLPELYMRFINTPAHWLEGVAPALYFARYTDVDALLALLQAYDAQDVPVPDLLLERITDLGTEAVEGLCGLAADAQASRALRLCAINLLIEIDTDAPLSLCVSLVCGRTEQDEVADAAADLLRNVGQKAVLPMLEALEGASDSASETFLELLCNFPDTPRVYEETVARFQRESDRRALYASFLAKLADPRAIEPLRQASTLSDLSYLDFIEIRDAIEALGGTLDVEREFSGDPYYESMKRL